MGKGYVFDGELPLNNNTNAMKDIMQKLREDYVLLKPKARTIRIHQDHFQIYERDNWSNCCLTDWPLGNYLLQAKGRIKGKKLRDVYIGYNAFNKTLAFDGNLLFVQDSCKKELDNILKDLKINVFCAVRELNVVTCTESRKRHSIHKNNEGKRRRL